MITFCLISLYFLSCPLAFFVFLKSSGQVCNVQICNIKRISSISLKLFLVHEFLISIVYVKYAYMLFNISKTGLGILKDSELLFKTIKLLLKIKLLC